MMSPLSPQPLSFPCRFLSVRSLWSCRRHVILTDWYVPVCAESISHSPLYFPVGSRGQACRLTAKDRWETRPAAFELSLIDICQNFQSQLRYCFVSANMNSNLMGCGFLFRVVNNFKNTLPYRSISGNIYRNLRRRYHEYEIHVPVPLPTLPISGRRCCGFPWN